MRKMDKRAKEKGRKREYQLGEEFKNGQRRGRRRKKTERKKGRKRKKQNLNKAE